MYGPRDKAEVFADTLKSQFTCPKERPKSEEKVTVTIETLNNTERENVLPISPGEIKFIVNKLPRNKVLGPDGITNTALKHLSERAILHITKIFNTCLRLKYFPVKWKQATVKMISMYVGSAWGPKYQPLKLGKRTYVRHSMHCTALVFFKILIEVIMMCSSDVV